jgi:peptide/nickel transport system substrate-binding protein
MMNGVMISGRPAVRILLIALTVGLGSTAHGVPTLLAQAPAPPQVAPPMPPDPATPKKGGVLVLADKGLGQSHFDVYQFDGIGPTEFFTAQIYNLLVRGDRYDETKIHPELADSWQVSPDGKTLTFKLHRGVTWHDGKPFTSADVVATYRYAQKPPAGMTSNRSGDFRAVESIEGPDPYTVVIKLSRPQPDFLANLGSQKMPIYPKHLLEPLLAKGEGMKFTLVGTGPFKVKSYQPDIRWEVERNPNYWKKDLPYLDGAVWTYTKEETLQAAAYKAGRLDIAYQLEQAANLQEARETPGSKSVAVSQANIASLILAVDHKPFDDIRVRKAIALTLADKLAFVRDAAKLTNFSVAGAGFTPGSQWALPYDRLKKIPGYNYREVDMKANRAEAAKILKDAGYPVPLEFTLTANTTNEMMQPAILVQQMLNQGPFKVKMDLMEYAKYYEVIAAKKNAANVHAMTMKNVSPDGVLGECCTSAGRRNFGRYKDPELDELFDRQSAELDPAKRRELVYQYQEKWLSKYYHIQMAWGTREYIWKDYVHGYWPHVNPANIMWLESVWLAK